MATWMEERDRLVAQTQAFVQQVAAAHPRTVPHELAVPPGGAAEIERPAAPAADRETPVVVAAPIAVAAKPLRRLPPVASERTDILQRVAAFRARQARVNEERETYYQTMQAIIRSQLGNEAGTGRL